MIRGALPREEASAGTVEAFVKLRSDGDDSVAVVLAEEGKLLQQQLLDILVAR